MDPRVVAFGQAVRARRTGLGLTQEQLAERAGLHPNFVSLIERGKTHAALDVVFAVADALETAAATLVGAAETEPARRRRRNEAG